MLRLVCRSPRRVIPCGSRRICTTPRALAIGVLASVGSCAAMLPAVGATAGASAGATARGGGRVPQRTGARAEPYATALPDCRAYEQVSPVEKNYADALGAVTSVRAAPSGEAVTFDSLGPFPLGGGSPRRFLRRRLLAAVQHLSERAWPRRLADAEPGARGEPRRQRLAAGRDRRPRLHVRALQQRTAALERTGSGRRQAGALHARQPDGGLPPVVSAGARRKRQLLLRRGRRGAIRGSSSNPATGSAPKPRWACAASTNGTKDSWPWSICFPAVRPRMAVRRAGAARGLRKKRSNCPTTRSGMCPTS